MKPPKIRVFRDLYSRPSWVQVHFDSRVVGVVVPRHLVGQRHVTLQYGRDMPKPIPDLRVTESGLSATLSFDQIPFETFIPWAAVYAMNNDEGLGMMYEDEIPEGVKGTAEDAGPDEAEAAEIGPGLRLVEPDADPGETITPTERPTGPPKLRIVN